MHFATLIAVAATVAIGTNAAALRRDGARLAQFRVFGADGCSASNYGFYTVDASDAGVCHGIDNVPSAIKSLNLEVLYSPAAEGCSVNIYTDTACSVGKKSTTVGVCNNVPVAGEAWNSWEISCPEGSA
ncbi:hypothetical protein HD806DRAFT_375074 [Xylariaceae sp. AK1471]|nr:hypothetical protein HD806DRAFT_375074 [Xylariaceae sp. AK1471]